MAYPAPPPPPAASGSAAVKILAVIAAILAVVVVAAAVYLFGFAGSDDDRPAAPASSAGAPAPEPAAPAPGEAQQPAAPSAASVPKSRADVAVGQIPSGATEVTGWGTGSDLQARWPLIESPTGNISCKFPYSGLERLDCTVDDGQSRTTAMVSNGQVDITDGLTSVKNVDPNTVNRPPGSPQVVQYGQTVYSGTYVCHAEQDGVTCWDSATGAGVFLSRASVHEL